MSYVGYFAMKLAGENLGAGLTGFFGGLSSSTATSLSFARQNAAQPDGWHAHAGAVVIASATVFPRILIVVSAIDPVVMRRLLPAFGTAAVVAYASGIALILTAMKKGKPHGKTELKNPLELVSALKFGVLLAVITVGAVGLRKWLGNSGVYAGAALAGIADVDAITLSLSRLAKAGMGAELAAEGIALAVGVNTLVKAGLVGFIASRTMAMWVVGSLLLALASGAVASFLL